MCGRFYLDVDVKALADHFDIAEFSVAAKQWRPRYNIAPGQEIALIRQKGKERELSLARWGLVPHWSKAEKPKYSTINARAETLAEKPAYREPFKRRRCLIPACGFFEWKQGLDGKTPYLIRRANNQLMTFAGLWDHWEREGRGFDSCSIIVTRANPVIAQVHERMPVILQPEWFAAWLDPGNRDTIELQTWLMPYAGELVMHPVSRYVNSPAHDDVRCIEGIG